MNRHPILEVRLLGGFEVRIGTQTVPEAVWGQRRAAAIIKLLALESGHRLHREQVLDTLWPELDPESAANNLRVALHHARRGLEQAGAPAGRYLTRASEMLVLGPPDGVRVDVGVFAEAAARAWQFADPVMAEEAAAQYGGVLLPDDIYEEWAAARREMVRTSFLTLLARLSGLYEQRGELPLAIATRERALAVDPHDDAMNAAVIRLHAAMGQPEVALAHYARYAALLRRDVGAEPERATRDLADAVRGGGHAIAITPARPAAPTLGVVSALPDAVDDLVGRERELAELGRMLARSRLVVLTGPGGIGKTRLALEAARASRERFRDGTAFVDLATLRDPGLVLPTAARALGVDVSAGTSVSEALAAAIGTRRVLLVLDNLEQVAASGTAIVALLTACPQLSVLGTSRVRLRVRGEQEYSVGPLAFPSESRRDDADAHSWKDAPAVALFLRRAQAARPDFVLSEGNENAIAAVCRRLDGLPLALELAAARMRVLTPQELLRRLERPLDALGSGGDDLPERQRTLRETIAWSFDLLEPAERELFRRLAVFAGGCTLEAATRVAGSGVRGATPAAGIESEFRPPLSDTLDLLSRLVDQSLLDARQNREEETRYRMLETIREYALERLAESGEAEAVHRALEDFLLELAEDADEGFLGSGQTEWLNRIEAEHDTIRSALVRSLERGDVGFRLRLATSMAPFWRARGFAREGVDWLQSALALAGNEPVERRAAALDALGGLAVDAGEYFLAAHSLQEGVDLWMALGERRATVQGLFALAAAKSQSGADAEARSALEEALDLAREDADARGIATALHNLGMIDREAGDLDEAATRLLEAMTIWRRVGDAHWIAVTASNLGDVHRLSGDIERARVCFAESADRYSLLGDRFGLGVVANQQGLLHQAEGRFKEAMQSHAEALRHFEAVQAPLGVIESIEWLALAAADSADAVAALRLFAAAASAREERGLGPLAADATLVAAGIDRARERVGAAAEAALSGVLMLTLDEARAAALGLTQAQQPH